MARAPPTWSAGLPRVLAAEFVSTAMLVYYTLATAVFSGDGGLTTVRQLQASVVAGCTVATLCFIFAENFFNPAVTIAFAAVGRLAPARAAAYVVAQCAGAVLGAGAVRLMSPEQFRRIGGGVNVIQPGATATEALGVEFALVFVLVLAASAAGDGARPAAHAHAAAIAPLIIGTVAAVGGFVAIPVDACSMNPARSFGVALVAGQWDDQIIFWAGPILGGVAAALVYENVLSVAAGTAAPQKEVAVA